MKKLSLAALCLLSLLLSLSLAACGGGDSDASYQDGSYTGISSEDDEGSYAEVTLTLEGGEITACDFVTWQSNGTIKNNEDYGKIGGTIANPDYYAKAQLAVEAMEQYAQQLLVVQDAGLIEAVSGATISYDQFGEAVDDALKQAQE